MMFLVRGYGSLQLKSSLLFWTDSNRLVEAVKWLKIAATAGHVRAQYSLALCLQQGKGVECNMQKAVSFVFMNHLSFPAE